MACCGKRAVNLVRKGVEVVAKVAFSPKELPAVKEWRLRQCQSGCGLLHLSRFKVPFCGVPYDGAERENEMQVGCGCCLSLKAWLKDEHCPRGAW